MAVQHGRGGLPHRRTEFLAMRRHSSVNPRGDRMVCATTNCPPTGPGNGTTSSDRVPCSHEKWSGNGTSRVSCTQRCPVPKSRRAASRVS